MDSKKEITEESIDFLGDIWKQFFDICGNANSKDRGLKHTIFFVDDMTKIRLEGENNLNNGTDEMLYGKGADKIKLVAAPNNWFLVVKTAGKMKYHLPNNAMKSYFVRSALPELEKN